MSGMIKAAVLCVVLGAALPAMAAGMGEMKDSNGMKGGSAMGDMKAPPSATTADAVGTVKAIDKPAGKITLSHGPIKALNWPAMTMGFKVADPKLLDGLAVGQKVDFTLASQGGTQTVTAIHPAK